MGNKAAQPAGEGVRRRRRERERDIPCTRGASRRMTRFMSLYSSRARARTACRVRDVCLGAHRLTSTEACLRRTGIQKENNRCVLLYNTAFDVLDDGLLHPS